MTDKYYWVSMDGTCEIGDMTKEQLSEVVLTLLAMLKRAKDQNARDLDFLQGDAPPARPRPTWTQEEIQAATDAALAEGKVRIRPCCASARAHQAGSAREGRPPGAE